MTTLTNDPPQSANTGIQKPYLVRNERFVFVLDDPRQQLQHETRRCEESPPAFYGSIKEKTQTKSNRLRQARDVRETSLPSLSERKAQTDRRVHLRQELRRMESPTSVFYLDQQEKENTANDITILRSCKDHRETRLPTLEYRQSQDDSVMVAKRRLEQIAVKRVGSKETLPHRISRESSNERHA